MFSSFRRFGRRFGRDRRGNFAMAAAVLSVPVVMGVGLAVDLSSVERARAGLQQALDAAALAVAREGALLPDSAAQRIAGEFMHANFNGEFANLSVRRNGTEVTVTADAVAETAFGGVLGYEEWKVSGLSTADIAMLPYEIALVLDTTGSMKGGKLAAMKDAVIGLVDTMSANVKEKENLKFAVVPFSSFVNVGPQFAPKFDKKGKVIKGTGASWLDVKGDSDIPQVEFSKKVSRFEVFNNLGVAWAGCVETRDPTKRLGYDVLDIAPNKNAESLFVPAFSIDEPEGPGYRNNYVASNVKPLDKSVTGKVKKLLKYGLAPALGGLGVDLSSLLDPDEMEWKAAAADMTGGKGPNQSCVTQPISPLGTDYSGIKTKVQGLAANGNTNIMEGVAWGWRVLSPAPPFTEGASKKTNTRKIMIVLTDGSNVFGVNTNAGNELRSSYSSFGFAADERLMPVASATDDSTNAAMNAKTLTACTNAKAEGLEIFTIRLEEPNKTTGMMLKECATDPDHFFDAPSRSQLDEVFGRIRDKITSVRITS